MVSPFVNLSLFDAIDKRLGNAWVGIERPLRPVRPASRIVFLNSQEYLDGMGLPRVLAPPDDPRRVMIAWATRQFLFSDLFQAFAAGALIVEATPPGPEGLADPMPPIIFGMEFWQAAELAIGRDPPMFAQRITRDGKKEWRRYANPMVRAPADAGERAQATGSASSPVAPGPKERRGNVILKDIKENFPELVLLKGRNERARKLRALRDEDEAYEGYARKILSAHWADIVARRGQ